MTALNLTPLPPAEAVDFFRAKGYEIGFDWRDVWQSEHSRAFTVAKATRLDILETIRQEVDRALADGRTKRQFIDALAPRLQQAGWWGRAELPDPLTGEVKRVQLGSTRRLEVIYDANLRTSRAAGRWARIQRLKQRQPYLRYTAVLDSVVRPQHRAWHSIILPVDHPFWDTHYPPNGWRCRCNVVQLSQADLDRRGWAVSTDEEVEQFLRDTAPWRNPRTGDVIDLPRGIQPGWAYNVGKAPMRGLTPPPGGPLQVPTTAASSAPLPPVRQRPASRLLPRDPAATDDNIAAFLADFGAAPGRPVVFRDRLGEPVVISEDLFRWPDGSSKLPSGMRREALLLVADMIRDPDEIWWHWEAIRLDRDDPTRVVNRLRRRYLARFQVAGRDAPMAAAFDTGRDGWTGVTAFRPRKPDYLMRLRQGTLAYRRS